MLPEAEPHEAAPHEHALREAGTVGLYLSIVLLAVLVGLGGGDASASDEIAVIWGTAIGLGIAHLFAFRMTAIAAAGGRMTTEDWAAIIGMAISLVAVATIATIPYLVTDDTLLASTVAMVLLLAIIAVTAFVSARHAGLPMGRAIGYTVVTVVLAAVVVFVKYQLTH